MKGDHVVITLVLLCIFFFTLGLLTANYLPPSFEIHINSSGILSSILLSIITGIVSGAYVSMVVTKFIRFQELVREATLQWYKLQPEWSEDGQAHSAEITDIDTLIRTADKLLFIAEELQSLGHTTAHSTLKSLSVTLSNEMSKSGVQHLHQWLTSSRIQTKQLKPNTWALMRIFTRHS